jgi:alpha-glucosidase
MEHIAKDDRLRNNPPSPGSDPDAWPEGELMPAFSTNQPGLREIVHEMSGVVGDYPERIIIGENHLSLEWLLVFYQLGVTHPYNSKLMSAEWDSLEVRSLVDTYEGLLSSTEWPNWPMGSHDDTRLVDRVGHAQARTAAMLGLTARGTPILYYGDEIGMHNVKVPQDRLRDPFEKLVPGEGEGRDPQRSPMQWTGEEKAGFTSGDPWLPVAEDAGDVNVDAQRDDPKSTLNLYRRLLALRNEHAALREGLYTPDVVTTEGFAFVRELDDRRFLIALNFTGEPIEFGVWAGKGKVLLSTHLDHQDDHVGPVIKLREYEGLVVELE